MTPPAESESCIGFSCSRRCSEPLKSVREVRQIDFGGLNYGSNRYVGASLDAWEGPKTFTSCPEAWHTFEDILEDDSDAIILVPHE